MTTDDLVRLGEKLIRAHYAGERIVVLAPPRAYGRRTLARDIRDAVNAATNTEEAITIFHQKRRG